MGWNKVFGPWEGMLVFGCFISYFAKKWCVRCILELMEFCRVLICYIITAVCDSIGEEAFHIGFTQWHEEWRPYSKKAHI